LHAWLWTLLPPLPRWTVPNSIPHSLAFTPDCRSLVTCERDNVSVWDVASGRREHAWPKTAPRPTYNNARAMMVMSPTDRRVIVYDIRCGGHESPRLIDLDTGRTTALPRWEYLVPADDPCIGFLPNGQSAWQIDAVMKPTINNVLRVWDLPDGQPRTIVVRSRLYAEPSFSSDGRRAALAPHTPHSPAGSVQLLDLAAGRVSRELVLDGRQSGNAVLSADGRTVAIAAAPVFEGGAIGVFQHQLIDADTGESLTPLTPGGVNGWSAAGRLVVSSPDESMRYVDGGPGGVGRLLANGQLIRGGRFLLSHEYRERPAVVRWLLEWLPIRLTDPDAVQLVYSVHDTVNGRHLGGVVTDVRDPVALSEDGMALAIADSEGLRLWDLPPRRPGGIVLGVMIVQVGLLTAWTAWSRFRASVGTSARRVRSSKEIQDSSG
jgi:hypothetical protein